MIERGLVIIGASLAGLRAAESARAAGYRGDVTLVGSEEHPPYDRPPLSKAALAQDGPISLAYHTEERLGELGIGLRLGETATELDLSERKVTTTVGELPYGSLVIATGSHARTIPGQSRLRGIHSLRTVDDCVAIRNGLRDARNVVVIGGGFIGAEVASVAKKRGSQVTIVEAERVPLGRAVGQEVGSALVALHRRHGVRMLAGCGVAGFDGDRHVKRVRLTDGTSVDADLVVVGIGADPATAWLESSGLPLDHGVLAASDLSTPAEAVFVAGDATRWMNPMYGHLMRLENWTSAAEQGKVAGANAVSPERTTTFSTVPYAWSDWYDHRVQTVGVPTEEAEVVAGDLNTDRFVAVFFREGLIVGAVALNFPSHIMKYRALIGRHAHRDEALAFARSRSTAAPAARREILT